MREADISDALTTHLLTLADIPPVVWENTDLPADRTRPYLVVQTVRTSRRSPDLAGGGGVIARGYLQVTIVHEVNATALPAEELADTIAAHFPKGLRIAGGGGEVTVMDEPNILTAYRDGADWRLPIQIDYWAS